MKWANSFKSKWKTTEPTTIVLWPLYRSTSVSRHLQLRTGGFCWSKVLLPACPCWRQPVHSDYGEHAGFLLVIYIVSIPCINKRKNTHLFNGPFPGLPRWASTRKVKPIWILLKQETLEWQWHQLGHMQVCTSLQTDNHASTPPLSILQARCPSCRPTNSVKALKAQSKR